MEPQEKLLENEILFKIEELKFKTKLVFFKSSFFKYELYKFPFVKILYLDGDLEKSFTLNLFGIENFSIVNYTDFLIYKNKLNEEDLLLTLAREQAKNFISNKVKTNSLKPCSKGFVSFYKNHKWKFYFHKFTINDYRSLI